MKKRILSVMLALCTMLTMLPMTVLATEVQKSKGLGMATEEVQANYEIPTNSKGGWPFVPSTKNTANGSIKSGWYFILSHDLGKFSISDSNMVNPSRRTEAPFYIEHLGNDVYYIYEAYGKYLSYSGDAKHGAQITVSDKPCKWKIYMDYDWQKKYTFRADANKNLVISTYGLCSETQDSMVKLTEQLMSWTSVNFKAQFTIDDRGTDRYIPQWYKDYQNGLDAPIEIEKPKEFGDVPSALKHTTKEEWDVLRLTNIERSKAGLPMLVTFDTMQKFAGVRSDEIMVAYNPDHSRPDGRSCMTVFSDNGFSHTLAAENIAKGQTSAKSVVEAWMNSSGHRANILNSGLRYMGTGFSYNNTPHWTQLFATNGGSECTNISYSEDQGFFILKLKNGITAYAPYDPISSPTEGDEIVFKYPGVGSTAPKYPSAMQTGWYNLRAMNNYLNLDKNGDAELRKLTSNQAYYAESKGNGQITLKMSDGNYLGVSSDVKNGTRVKSVSSPYIWTVYSENNNDIFSLRPSTNNKMVVNASGQKNDDGTHIILWTHEALDAPNNVEFRFIPASSPTSGGESKHPFTDVKAKSYYESAVIWALKNKVTSGTSETTFSPYVTCTRSQVATFLWRSQGSPEPKSTRNPFGDVKSSDYYYKAVLWAVENGITAGTSSTTFSPNSTCTSAQVITFLHRSNGEPLANGKSNLATQYAGNYYTNAIGWADTTGLISGTGAAFVPDNKSPRADIVTYLYRNAGSPGI